MGLRLFCHAGYGSLKGIRSGSLKGIRSGQKAQGGQWFSPNKPRASSGISVLEPILAHVFPGRTQVESYLAAEDHLRG